MAKKKKGPLQKRPRLKPKIKKPVIIPLYVMAVLAFFLMMFIYSVNKAKGQVSSDIGTRSLLWPKAKGKMIFLSGPINGQQYVDTEYEYTVNGVAYSNDRVSAGRPAQEVYDQLRLKEYEMIDVHYDPEDPQQSILIKGYGSRRGLHFVYYMILPVLMSIFAVLVHRQRLGKRRAYDEAKKLNV